MRQARASFGLTAHDGCLYVAGGRGTAQLTAERYDPREGIWAPLPNMNHGKNSAAAASASIGGRIAVVGMSNGQGSMELFNLVSSHWEVTNGTPPCIGGSFRLAWCPWKNWK